MRTPILAVAIIMCAAANAQEIDWKKIDDVLGRSSAVTGDVHRYGFPRTDLNVTLEGAAINHVSRAWRMDCIQTDARRSDDDGRSRLAGKQKLPR